MTAQDSQPEEQKEERQARDHDAHWGRYVKTLKVPEGSSAPTSRNAG